MKPAFMCGIALAIGIGLVLAASGGTQEMRAYVLPPVATTTDEPPTALAQKKEAVLPDLEPKKSVAVLGAPIVAGADYQPFLGRLTMRTDVGDGVGYTRGFTTIEAMIPLWQRRDALLFTDLRVVNFLTPDRWEYNAGLGYRWFSPLCNCVLGANTFYDGRRTDAHYWQQIGVGVEALTPNVEFRANGYFIIGPQSRQNGAPIFINQGVINNNIVMQRLQPVEHALNGLDAEIGGRLPFLDRFVPRAYLGYYTYSSEGIEATHGIRGRLEAQLTPRASVHFAIQHDRLFQTTLSGGVTFALGAPVYRSGSSGPATWSDVLHQRLHRDINIVIAPGTDSAPVFQPLPPPTPPLPPEEPSEGEGG